jgi:hypothetical protein
MGDKGGAYGVLVMERGHLEDLGVYGGIILKCLFKTSEGEAWTVQF